MDKTSKRIFIIDDNPHILKPLSILLTGLGYSVTSDVDGRNALRLRPPLANLILLDSRLQGMRGQDICRTIKQNKVTMHIPIIMYSADSRIKVIAQEAGADDSIEKPFTMDDLVRKIRMHIKH